MREAVLCCDLLAFYRKLQNGRPCLFPPVLFLSLISHFFALPFLRAASTTTLDIMTGSPPDMSTLNIAPQRLHDSYDYEGNSPAGRQPYHFATTTGIPAQSAYQGLGVGQSPLKNKPARGGLPTVSY